MKGNEIKFSCTSVVISSWRTEPMFVHPRSHGILILVGVTADSIRSEADASANLPGLGQGGSRKGMRPRATNRAESPSASASS